MSSSYLVLERPRRGAAEADFMIVRDRFSWLAFLFPPLWALFHRLWIEALAIFALGAVIGVLGSWEATAPAAPLVGLAAMFLFGLEANGLRAAALRRRGFADWGVVEADNSADAELRYIAERYDAEPAPEALPVIRPASGAQHAPAFGLLGFGSGR